MTFRSDSQVKLALHRFMKKLTKEYGELFPYRRAPEAFLVRLSEIDGLLTKVLAKRPITSAEIDSLADRAYKRLRVAMIEASKATPQPNYQECTHILTGEVRLI